jgi:RHS repeat-associated protein
MANRSRCFGSPFTFTGELLDANDLLYLRARYYSPALGVFTALDPLENLNRYQYVGGNVVNATDPSGMFMVSPGLWDACNLQQQGGLCDFTVDSQNNIVLKYPNSFVASDCLRAAIWLHQNAPDIFWQYAYDHEAYCRPDINSLAAPIENTLSAHRFCLAYLDGLRQHDPDEWHRQLGHVKPQFLKLPSSPRRYLTIGTRLEASIGSHIGIDVNFEQHCTLVGGGILGLPKPKCGWFANVSYVGSTALISANLTGGVVLGLVSFPEEAGTTFVYAIGGNVAPGAAFEGDITRSMDGEYVIFGGIGLGVELSIFTGVFGIYGTIGASVYMGPQFFLFMTPKRSWDRLGEVIELLANEGLQ